MKKIDKNKKIPDEISISYPINDLPENAFEMINNYGTYEIQNTANTENQYPAIAQGFNPKIITEDCENKDRKTHNGEPSVRAKGKK